MVNLLGLEVAAIMRRRWDRCKVGGKSPVEHFYMAPVAELAPKESECGRGSRKSCQSKWRF